MSTTKLTQPIPRVPEFKAVRPGQAPLRGVRRARRERLQGGLRRGVYVQKPAVFHQYLANTTLISLPPHPLRNPVRCSQAVVRPQISGRSDTLRCFRHGNCGCWNLVPALAYLERSLDGYPDRRSWRNAKAEKGKTDLCTTDALASTTRPGWVCGRRSVAEQGKHARLYNNIAYRPY